MRLLFALLTLVLAASAFGQGVRPMSGSSFTAAAYRQAQKEGRDWPNLAEGDDGTVVQFSGDNDDADMIVTSTADEARLLAAVRASALAAGLPQTDYLKRHGTLTASVDAEFNDYLRREGRDTRFSFPIARLLQGLKVAKLPSPFRVTVNKEGESAVLVGPKGRLALTKERTLFSPEELEVYETLEIRFHTAWWAPLAAGFILLFFGGAILFLPFLILLGLPSKPFIGPPPPPPTPEEVQRAYDARASRPLWRRLVGFLPIAFVLPMFLITNKAVMRQAVAGMPSWVEDGIASPWAFPTMFLMMSPGLIANWVRARRLRRESPGVPNPLAGMWPMFLGLFFMMGLLVVSRLSPGLLRAVPREYQRPLLIGIPAALGGLSVFLMWRNGRRARRELPADDPVAVAARELGSRAGVRVRRVVEDENGGPNAFASLFGTVGVTRKLRETLDEDEVRAVLAHEIGHLKASDPGRTFALSLGLFATVLGAGYFLSLRTPLGESPLFQAAWRLFLWFGFPFLSAILLSPRRRRAEHAADRFAVQQTGDVELVARALVKIHDANLAPHRLHPRDERFASHPALAKRLERLREEGL